MPPLTDEELIADLKSHRERAFGEVYERYASLLLRYAYRFCQNQPQAEEVLHDVFSELLKEPLPPFGAGGLKPWLFTVTKNKCLNVVRRNSRDASSSAHHVREAVRTPEDELNAHQFAQRFQECERRLPGDLLETWSLRRQGLDYQQIATRLAIPVGTVKSRFNRLTQLLRKELGHESQ